VAIVLALSAIPGAAVAAVTVKGKITGGAKLLNPVWNAAKDPKGNRYTFREPSATVRPDVRVLTGFLPKELCIVALGEKGAPGPVRSLAVAGGRISPVTIVVPEGQPVQFENKDPFPHTLYEPTGKAGLQPGETLPGKPRAWTPSGPGKWEILDKTAPSVRAWVVVEPRAVAYAYPDRKGDFAMEIAEPGVYKLRGYFNGEPVGKELEVTVKPGPAEQLIANALVLGEGSGAPAAAADAGAPAADAGDGG